MTFKEGWLKRQVEQAKKETTNWPKWEKNLLEKNETTTKEQVYCAAAKK